MHTPTLHSYNPATHTHTHTHTHTVAQWHTCTHYTSTHTHMYIRTHITYTLHSCITHITFHSHTHAHVHMLTHKHSDTHCMSVPIATCIEWLCEMLKCTCVCEGGRGQNRATHSSRWEGNSSPPPTHKPSIYPSTSPTKSLPGAGCGDKICGIHAAR